jgi:hypothetical protein
MPNPRLAPLLVALHEIAGSDIADCCYRASFSSRVSRSTSASAIGLDEDATATRRVGFSAFRRRRLIGSPPALERRFIASP